MVFTPHPLPNTPNPTPTRGRNYGRALFLTAAVQGVSLIIENEVPDSIVFIFSCCLAMGLQNSLTSKYSGSVVRTTHLTGASTDLVSEHPSKQA